MKGNSSTSTPPTTSAVRLYWLFYARHRLKGYTPLMSKKQASIEYKIYLKGDK